MARIHKLYLKICAATFNSDIPFLNHDITARYSSQPLPRHYRLAYPAGVHAP